MSGEPIAWNTVIWNAMVAIFCVLFLLFGLILIFFTPETFRDVVQKYGIQIITITFTVPAIAFLLAMDKISKEAGLSLLGAIIGYAFGKA